MRQVNMHIEGVPNPHAIKFVLENGILSQDEFEFKKFGETGFSPLARKIMMLKYVDSVLIHRNYITVRKSPHSNIEWEDVLQEVRSLIVGHLSNNEPILYIGAKESAHAKVQDDLELMITQILDRHIRPAAQEDGGDILFHSLENGTLRLTMAGACIACPYAPQTIKNGVEPVMNQFIPEIKKVVWME